MTERVLTFAGGASGSLFTAPATALQHLAGHFQDTALHGARKLRDQGRNEPYGIVFFVFQF